MKNYQNQQRSFIYEFLKALDCPRALTVWLLYSSNEHQQLIDLEFDPRAYNCCCEAEGSLAATKLLSKATFLDLSIDREKVAIEKFFAAEEQCRDTNRRLRSSRVKPRTASIMLMAARKIANVLGDFCIDEFLDACDWGPGATLSLPRREASHPKKFEIESQITSKAYDLFSDIMDLAYPHWERSKSIVEHNKVITVPKNAKTDRVIAIEPGINLWLQKGVGTMMKRRLKSVGIDLYTQRHNQSRARIGSKFDELATIDFSAASDTVSCAVVEELIPQRWLTVMRALRSTYGRVGDDYIYYEKFSSMGNGFTFELETLIFWAVAASVHEINNLSTKHITVFGDDVVISSRVADEYRTVCADLGFKVNESKSYSSSYYRESCGEHYWHGVDIKPIFLKEPIRNVETAVKTANRVREYSHRRSIYGSDRLLRRSWLVLAGICGSKTPRIPAGYGDLGLIDTIDNARGIRRPDGQLEGFLVPMLVSIPQTRESEGMGLLNYKLKGIGAISNSDLFRLDFDGKVQSLIDERETPTAEGNEIPLAGRTRTVRKYVLVPRWTDLGDWN